MTKRALLSGLLLSGLLLTGCGPWTVPNPPPGPGSETPPPPSTGVDGFTAGIAERGWMKHFRSAQQEDRAVTVRTTLGEADTATAIEMCEYTWSSHEAEGRDFSSVTVLGESDHPLATRDLQHPERCESV